MLETPAELSALQTLLDRSIAGAGTHLTSIVSAERRLNARQLVAETVGMKVLVVATTTASGEPRTSCVDGHFLHGSWAFTTGGEAQKARHLERRPALSATYADGERVAVFAHGCAVLLNDTPDFPAYDAHLTRHYGSSPMTWGSDIRYYRLEPSWMVAYAMDAAGFRET